MDQAVSGSRLGQSYRSPKTYTKNRVCAHRSCSTKLSMYNARTLCRVHAPVKYPRVRGPNQKTRQEWADRDV